MSSINSLIRKYEFEDEILIKEIVRRASSLDLVNRINDCFREETDPERMGWLIQLVNDILCCRHRWVTRRYSNNFRQHLNESEFRRSLDKKIITDLNKINFHLSFFFNYTDASYLPIIQKMYKHALKYEPLAIPQIVDDMHRFQLDFNWSIIKNLSRSQDFLHRWAILEILGPVRMAGSEQFYKKKVGTLRLLAKDPNPFVAQEAEYWLAKSQFDYAYDQTVPKSRLAGKNFAKQMRPFNKALNNMRLRYTFLEIFAKHSRLVQYFPDTTPSRDIIEGIIMFGWEHSVLDNDYDEWLAKRIKDYLGRKKV